MPMAKPVGALDGCHVVVTRPAGQEAKLCQLIEASGGVAIHFPVLEIQDAEDQGPLREQIQHLDRFDLAVFISPNAVNRAMNLINAHGGLPADIQTAVVGRGSGRELARYLGREPDLVPRERYSSEGLLVLEPLQDMHGKRVIIFRGDGGRELLANSLRERGAEVEYAEVYRRGRPEVDNRPLLHAWGRGEVDIITVTSAEGLRNLFDMVGQLGRQWLRNTPILVINERLVMLARELGVETDPVVSEEASDEGIVAALAAWAQR